jgi:phage replication-related protein YjqB (UPF0714/DUF867 family)
MANVDIYKNYKELSQYEKEGVDYSITARPVAGSTIAIVAPHGGKIEFQTAELAESIAGDNHNFYAFRGLKKEGNRCLHLTSHRFDEKRALEIIKYCEKVITVHGLGGGAESLQVGGRDEKLRTRINDALHTAGFESQVVTKGNYAGMDCRNICNRGSTNAGVQLEIAMGLRLALKSNDNRYARFVNALRSAL